jgi:hypothetical protein
LTERPKIIHLNGLLEAQGILNEWQTECGKIPVTARRWRKFAPMKFFVTIAFLALTLPACLNNETKQTPPESSVEEIIHDYRISSEEGGENVALLLQHRAGGLGEPGILVENSRLSLDGRQLEPDSAKLTGVFYEVQLPAAGFEGVHQLVFTDAKGEEHRADFTYKPFTLSEELPKTLRRKPFTIRLANFPTEPSTVQLVMIDTSFSSGDVNEELQIENAELTVTEKQLSRLTNGPVTLELYYDQKLPLKNFASGRGRILISHSLRRQFHLTR